MKKLMRASLVMVLMGSMAAVVPAQSPQDVVVTEGVVVRVALQTPLSSKLSEVGDPVRAVLYDDLIVDGTLVLERGAEFLGRVTHVKPAGRALKRAEMAIVFNRLKTPYGLEEIATALHAVDDHARDKKLKGDAEGVVRGDRNAGEALGNVRTGAEIGSAGAVGTILIGQSSGAYTAAGIGLLGAMGAGLLLSKGGEIKLPPGTILRVRFERPIKLPATRTGNGQ
jgi:hypothetical protein